MRILLVENDDSDDRGDGYQLGKSSLWLEAQLRQ